MSSDEETKRLLEEISEKLERLGNILGPIVPESMLTMDGWTWSGTTVSARRLLQRGRRVNLFDPIKNERGWLVQLAVYFSDPNTLLHFSCDEYQLSVSPFMMNVYGMVLPNNINLYVPVYNPGSPIGPLYGLIWLPAKFWPYRTEIRIEVEHPNTALTTTSQIVIAALGRQYIRDEKHFYETIFLEGRKQLVGAKRIEAGKRPFHAEEQ